MWMKVSAGRLFGISAVYRSRCGKPILRGAKWSVVRLQKLFQMGLHRLCESVGMVAPFQAAYNSALRMGSGHVENLAREFGEVLSFQTKRADRVPRMGVEAGADED